MFALFVILVLSLVLAVLLGDVDHATRQVGQQVLDQKCRLTRLRSHTNVEVCGPVRWEKTMGTNIFSSVVLWLTKFRWQLPFEIIWTYPSGWLVQTVRFAETKSYLIERGNHRAFEWPENRRELFRSMLAKLNNININNINKYKYTFTVNLMMIHWPVIK